MFEIDIIFKNIRSEKKGKKKKERRKGKREEKRKERYNDEPNGKYFFKYSCRYSWNDRRNRLAEILKTPLKKCKKCKNRSYLGETHCMFCGGRFK
ncbi:hypothetical protein [Methanolapillus ohkumae]|uniref:hypothetical protein n=1 Tax=Methanolapillus ohkumae TaxID=3028298 RepID=UPI0030B91087